MTEFVWNPIQEQARVEAICNEVYRHIMLYGGARSGKTFLIVWAVVVRALSAARSRHLIARFHFSHLKSSIIYDTFPKVLELCFPEMQEDRDWKMNRSDYFAEFYNGSEIWFGGLDEKERAEKILGNEYATVYLNECSFMPWASRNLVLSRLAQKTEIVAEVNRPLRNKVYYDCNPPTKGHWTYKLFMMKQHPIERQPIPNAQEYCCFGPMNPEANRDNIDMAEIRAMTGAQRKRFYDGLWGDEGSNALWTEELCAQSRFVGDELPDMQRVVVAIDPSGAAGPEDERSDEIGIVVCALGTDGNGYVLEDLSGKFGPQQWAHLAVSAYDRHDADAIVAETNFGGAMVKEILRAQRQSLPFREVKASRGKVIRAEPIAALFEQDKVKLANTFPILEDQLCAMTTAGYVGDRSPDRADAMVWGLTYLFTGIARKESEFRNSPLRVNLGYPHAKKPHGRNSGWQDLQTR